MSNVSTFMGSTKPVPSDSGPYIPPQQTTVRHFAQDHFPRLRQLKQRLGEFWNHFRHRGE